jgi:hypothetical protein
MGSIATVGRGQRVTLGNVLWLCILGGVFVLCVSVAIRTTARDQTYFKAASDLAVTEVREALEEHTNLHAHVGASFLLEELQINAANAVEERQEIRGLIQDNKESIAEGTKQRELMTNILVALDARTKEANEDRELMLTMIREIKVVLPQIIQKRD